MKKLWHQISREKERGEIVWKYLVLKKNTPIRIG